MADKLLNVKAFYEDMAYPTIRFVARARTWPFVPPIFSENMQALVDVFSDLATAIQTDDPAWRGNQMTGAVTEAPTNAAVKAYFRQLLRDAQGIRRITPYNTGPTERQMIIIGQSQDPTADSFMKRLYDAIKLDDPTFTI